VLNRRVVKKDSVPATQILIRWSNLLDTDATWEDYLQIRQQFPNFVFEDNYTAKERGVLASAMLLINESSVERINHEEELNEKESSRKENQSGIDQ
jgi:hypothetical protein